MQIDLNRFSSPCACGRSHEIAVKGIWIEENATRHLPRLLKQYEAPVFLCDSNTCRATQEVLRDFYEQYPVIRLASEPVLADNRHVDEILASLPAAADVLIAVGSGTIHDLARFVSFQKGIPFLSYPTAASVDGFVSTGAAMTWFGLKKTFDARSPLYVIADTNVFSRAPYPMTASGLGDLMGKYTCLADWKISHLVTGESFCERVCALVTEAAEEGKTILDDIRDRKPESMEKLMYALILSGLAMQMVGNSRPASGAEHHLSHLWEMHIVNPPIDALHGEKVSVGLLLCLEQYKKALHAIRNGNYTITDRVELETELLKKYLEPSGLFCMVMEVNRENLLTLETAENCRNQIQAIETILTELPSPGEMESFLRRAGCPTTLSDLGLPEQILEVSLQLSPYLKNRLTFMRLLKLFELGDYAR